MKTNQSVDHSGAGPGLDYLRWPRQLLGIGFCCLSWVGFGAAAPAIANVSVPAEGSLPQGAVTAEDVAIACGGLPVEAYVTHDSARLRRSFCELLAFPNLSDRESFSDVDPNSLIDNRSPSPVEMTLPSLWWSQISIPRQFGSYRLVDSWLAYEIQLSATRVVDVHVNTQIWRVLKYSEQYGALSHLAEEAAAYQYNLRLFNNNLRDPSLIGLYVCDFRFQAAAIEAGEGSSHDCVAIVDAEAIAGMQARLETPTEVARPTQEALPSGNAVVGANTPEGETTSGAGN